METGDPLEPVDDPTEPEAPADDDDEEADGGAAEDE